MSDQTKDNLQRWLPTILALVGILGSMLYHTREYGRLEERVLNMRISVDQMVTRAEYTAHREARTREYMEIRQVLVRLEGKLDMR